MTDGRRRFATALGGSLPLVAGVVLFDWSFADLLVAAWVENVAVGVVTVIRLGTTAVRASPDGLPPEHPLLKLKVNGAPVQAGSLRVFVGFATLFFCFHYGVFTVVHGAFTFGFALSSERLGIAAPTVGVAAVVLLLLRALIVHGADLYRDFFAVRGWNDPSQALTAFYRPYLRVIPLHITLVASGFVITFLSAADEMLTLLLVAVFAVTDYLASRSAHPLLSRQAAVGLAGHKQQATVADEGP